MSMPEFPNPDTILSREQAIDSILTSIAMEEMALSHILNAEGEKLQYIIKRLDHLDSDCLGVQKLLEVNGSVAALIDRIYDLQIILKNKLQIAERILPKRPVKPCPPEKPCRPPKPERPCRPKPERPCRPKRERPCPPSKGDHRIWTTF